MFDEFGNLLEDNGTGALTDGYQQLVGVQGSENNNVEILIETDHEHDMHQPLVENAKPINTFGNLTQSQVFPTTYDRDYMIQLSHIPERIRNVCIVGPLHSGKTSLMDLLVLEGHSSLNSLKRSVLQGWEPLKYMDTFKQEIERGISIKLNGFTTLVTDLNDKSIVLNIIDTPGHVNFLDEVSISIEASDIVLICIDVVEGVTTVVENLIRHCTRGGKQFIFILNKIDRLILDLKLTPDDCYMKLFYLIGTLNNLTSIEYSPELNNVIFASGKLGFTFTLREFAQMYYRHQFVNSGEQFEQFIKSLWNKELFLKFILIPMYKIITNTLTKSDDKVQLLNILQKYIKIKEIPNLYNDPLPMLKYVISAFFGLSQKGLYLSLQEHTGPKTIVYDKEDSLMFAQVLKHLDYCSKDYSLIRIYHGVLNVDDRVKIFNSEYNPAANDDDNNIDNHDTVQGVTINSIQLMGGRYTYPVSKATAGQIVLVAGINEYMDKDGFIYRGLRNDIPKQYQNMQIDYINTSNMKIIIEPQFPRELPKLINALNKISKYYPSAIIKVEESSEHIILGTGELYLDCMLYDLRKVYGEMEIKVSLPLTTFTESCYRESFASIPIESDDGNFQISIVVSPQNFELVKDISQNAINVSNITKPLLKQLRNQYDWDSLMARNLWCFENTNCLIDDTLPGETDKDILYQYKDSLLQGFYWAMKEGPLCDEPMFGNLFKIIKFHCNESKLDKSLDYSNQLIPLVKKACYVALFTANPILLEPFYEMSIITHTDQMENIENLLQQRRQCRIYSTNAIEYTPFIELRGQIPVIDSFGFETDLRLVTHGQAMIQMHCMKKIWKRVPGNVMDETVELPRLTPVPRQSMARDFMLKTRRRKGYRDAPSIERFIPADLYSKLQNEKIIEKFSDAH